jgi:transposase
MSGKRHSADEIAVKLRRANEMMKEGKGQAEIAKALGISIMTYHRWRRAVMDEGARIEGDRAGREEPNRRGADLLQEYETKIAALERMVGRQALEIEFLRGASRSALRPRSVTTSTITGSTNSPSRRNAD